jgi:flagellin
MALTVRTNVGALSAIKTLNGTQNSLTKSLGRVSSGSRINTAGDDAAGLSVSSRMKSDNVSLKAAMRNTNDGISLIQTAEGGLTEVYNILTRMRELTVQASNDTYSSTDRKQIKIEFNELRTEISRITSDANFNRISVLKSTKTLKFQIGINNTTNNQFELAMGSINATIGALGIVSTAALIATKSNATSLAAMRNTITLIDSALTSVNDKRAKLGAFQNRLESALNTASNYSQNLASAASQISDVDYASESADLTKYQIMQQAGVAALGQAKAIPQSILSLLG